MGTLLTELNAQAAPSGAIAAEWGREAYEATIFAKAAGISAEQATLLIRRHGLDRAALLAAARQMKRA